MCCDIHGMGTPINFVLAAVLASTCQENECTYCIHGALGSKALSRIPPRQVFSNISR